MIADILFIPPPYAIIIWTIGHHLFMKGIPQKYEFHFKFIINLQITSADIKVIGFDHCGENETVKRPQEEKTWTLSLVNS